MVQNARRSAQRPARILAIYSSEFYIFSAVWDCREKATSAKIKEVIQEM